MAGEGERAETARRQQIVGHDHERLLEHALGLDVVGGISGLPRSCWYASPSSASVCASLGFSRSVTLQLATRPSVSPSEKPASAWSAATAAGSSLPRRRARATSRGSAPRRGARRCRADGRLPAMLRFSWRHGSPCMPTDRRGPGARTGPPSGVGVTGSGGCTTPWLFANPWLGSATYGNVLLVGLVVSVDAVAEHDRPVLGREERALEPVLGEVDHVVDQPATVRPARRCPSRRPSTGSGSPPGRSTG